MARLIDLLRRFRDRTRRNDRLVPPRQSNPAYSWRAVRLAPAIGTILALPNNPDRIAALWSVTVDSVFIWPQVPDTTDTGLLIPFGVNPFVLKREDVGGLITAEWYVRGTGLMAVINVIEVTYRIERVR